MAESEPITPYLEKNGPTPRPELPVRPDLYHREQGVRFFHLSAGIGDTRAAGGTSVKIAYPEFVEAQTYRSVRRQLTNHGDEWVDACHPVLAEFFEKPDSPGNGYEAGETEECPLCETEVPKGGLPSHLTDCSEG